MEFALSKFFGKTAMLLITPDNAETRHQELFCRLFQISFLDFMMRVARMQLSVLLQTALIGLAGSCGACTRYLLGSAITKRTRTPFPFATLLINVTGAFAIALLFALATHKLLPPALQTILATGFLGGYTTFSTLCWESWNLARGGSRFISQFYLVGSLLLGLLAGLAGLWLGGLF